MITLLTQTSLAILHDIACRELSPRSEQYALFQHTLSDVLLKLESYGLIRLLPNKPRENLLSYELTRPASTITLLNVLEALDEHLNCNHETDENLYYQYGTAAQKLGLINDMTRHYLSDIRLTEL